jgi:hypothetical protein
MNSYTTYVAHLYRLRDLQIEAAAARRATEVSAAPAATPVASEPARRRRRVTRSLGHILPARHDRRKAST